VHRCRGTVVAQVAEVSVTGDKFTVDRVVCAVDCGSREPGRGARRRWRAASASG
jgi:hypothetical protein